MSKYRYGVGVIAPNFLLNLLLVKMSKKSLKKADFRSKKQKDMSHDGTYVSKKLYFMAIQMIGLGVNRKRYIPFH